MSGTPAIFVRFLLLFAQDAEWRLLRRRRLSRVSCPIGRMAARAEGKSPWCFYLARSMEGAQLARDDVLLGSGRAAFNAHSPPSLVSPSPSPPSPPPAFFFFLFAFFFFFASVDCARMALIPSSSSFFSLVAFGGGPVSYTHLTLPTICSV